MATSKRAGRGEETRERIIEAAIEAFANDGFGGTSTRRIAELAGANQGLITYHFGTKEKLWQAAVDSLFGGFSEALLARAAMLGDADMRTQMRLLIFFFVRHAAERPAQMRLMVQEGKANDPRTDWLVDRHIKPMYDFLVAFVAPAQAAGLVIDAPLPNLFYALVGSTSLIFAHTQECERLTGQNPMDEAVIEAHAETICRLFIREGEA